MGWFDKILTPFARSDEDTTEEGPSMHILALNPQSGAGPHAVQPEGSLMYALPAVTSNGRISFLSAGCPEDCEKMLEDVADRVSGQPEGTQSYICVAVAVRPVHSEESLLVYAVLGSPEPTPELERIYSMLVNLGCVGDANWQETERLLRSDPVKSWLNRFIGILQETLNWTQYVETALEAYTKP